MVISASTRNVSSKSIQYQQSDKEQSVEVCRNGLSGEKPKEFFKTQFLEDHAESRENDKRAVTDKEMQENYYRIIEEAKAIVS